MGDYLKEAYEKSFDAKKHTWQIIYNDKINSEYDDFSTMYNHYKSLKKCLRLGEVDLLTWRLKWD